MAYDKGYPVTFAVMLVASLVTGSIAARMKSHAKQSAQTAYRTKILLDTNQMLAKAKSSDEIFEIAASQTKKLLALDAFALRDNDLSKLGITGTSLCKTESCTYYPIHASNTVYGAAARMKNHAKQSAQTAYRTKILLDTNQMLAKAKSSDEIFEIAASQTKKLLALDAFAIRDNDLSKLGITGTSLCKTESCTYYPIHASNTVYGAIGIQSTNHITFSFLLHSR